MRERTKVTAKACGARREHSVSEGQKFHFSPSMIRPITQLLSLQKTVGNQAVQRLSKSGGIHAKLKTVQPGDIYEQEADIVADAVMHMPESAIQLKPLGFGITPLVQRQPKEEKEGPIQIKPIAEHITPLVQRQIEPEEEEETLQTKEVPGQTPAVTLSLESRIQSLKDGGQPLPHSVRNYFEPRFGYDFSHVRVHTDSKASETAKSVNAKAFTTGKDVVFGAGHYSPETLSGKCLLAHELTHVVQQASVVHFIAIQRIQEPPSLPASSTTPAGGLCLERPDALGLKELEECVRQLYKPKLRPTGFSRLAREFIKRIAAEARRLPDEDVAARKRHYFMRWRAAPPGSGEYAVADGFWWVFEHENDRRMRRAGLAFSPEVAAKIAAPLPQRMKGGMRCLEVFYSHLQDLYGAAIIAGASKTRQIADVILVKNVVERLQRKHRGGVPEDVLLEALAAEGIEREAASERLRTMRGTGMLAWSRPNRWRSTGEFGKGLITETGESLVRRGLAGERNDLPTPKAWFGGDVRRASQNLAARLLALITKWVGPIEAGNGNYFFAVSLHRDYHAVTLRVRLQTGKLQLFWADQYGERKMPNTRALAKEIEVFWPNNYWPAYSSVWPLLPRWTE
jgi:hypothetical protein